MVASKLYHEKVVKILYDKKQILLQLKATVYAGFLSGFLSRGVKMRYNGLLGGGASIILQEAKHMDTQKYAPLCKCMLMLGGLGACPPKNF